MGTILTGDVRTRPRQDVIAASATGEMLGRSFQMCTCLQEGPAGWGALLWDVPALSPQLCPELVPGAEQVLMLDKFWSLTGPGAGQVLMLGRFWNSAGSELGSLWMELDRFWSWTGHGWSWAGSDVGQVLELGRSWS